MGADWKVSASGFKMVRNWLPENQRRKLNMADLICGAPSPTWGHPDPPLHVFFVLRYEIAHVGPFTWGGFPQIIPMSNPWPSKGAILSENVRIASMFLSQIYCACSMSYYCWQPERIDAIDHVYSMRVCKQSWVHVFNSWSKHATQQPSEKWCT